MLIHLYLPDCYFISNFLFRFFSLLNSHSKEDEHKSKVKI